MANGVDHDGMAIRQTACMVVNPITVNNFASLFNCTLAGYLSVCHFVLVFFSPFSIAITSLGEERANLSAFRTFVRFVLV